ncbi:hypothetical protein [Prevotella sp. 10(H)]|uniref:hypothetical protein n=1 Tax=Prevotella sp. 10(H) TaxID=1158294 RepID=UPI00068C5ACC|nr:hypothetical protein [Prevotella sp. 10(H)]
MVEKINDLLAEWDPIGIGLPMSKYEYVQYVPNIISQKDNYLKLKEYIFTMLDNMGLYYNSESEVVQKDIEELIYKIQAIK